ncbi:microtubule-associated tyrosine carboxypeptidase 1 isoform X2 [Neopsephotus bourkii]|uniref:microtubule-associated tyrosine carboxypeptidase 1 isoform X2 n=1 Tax=Neopsephotus bourkii TaxID=309878 RepID=UPI002AA56531|nr:microtubule-associated tyrosine carboxypeptidase 1 isoform X2 [Neopsephotus bourkii]
MVLDPAATAGLGDSAAPTLSARHGPPLCPCPSPPTPTPALRCPRGARRLSETGAVMQQSEGAGRRGGLRAAASLPHIARGRAEEGGGRRSPCLLVALRPCNVEAERERFFRASFAYDPQFEYAEPVPAAVLDKYAAASDRFVAQAIRIIRAVLEKYGTYESFEVATGGRLLSKCQIWSVIRKYMQKEGCVGEVVVQLTDDLLSQAVMMVEDSRPTLAINLAGARQHWLEGMLRHEIGTHYIRGVNNTHQPWHSSEGRKQYSLKPANPTEEGLASLHSVLFRKQPFLWRAALLYYTIERASRLSFSALFQDLEQYVQDAGIRWEYCVRAKRGQTDTSQPGCFSKDQVYLDGILRILRHRQTIDFPLLAALGKVSYEDVNRLKKFGVLEKARIPHFMQDLERYMKQLDHIVTTNCLNEEELQQLLPEEQQAPKASTPRA